VKGDPTFNPSTDGANVENLTLTGVGTDIFQFLKSAFGNIDTTATATNTANNITGRLTNGVNFSTTSNGAAYDGANAAGTNTEYDAGRSSFIFGGGTLSYGANGANGANDGDAGFAIATNLGALAAADIEITAMAIS
jgi:hypothetical protein